MLGFELAWHGEIGHERDCYFRKMAIPERAIGPILRSWQLDGSPSLAAEHWPTIYGRYDFSLLRDVRGKVNGIKLLEFNADTPTSVLETVEIQWEYYRHFYDELVRRHGGELFQWNELYEKMVVAWAEEIEKYRRITGEPVDLIHVACSEADQEGEDAMTIGVIGSALEQASRNLEGRGRLGFRVKYITMESINRRPTSDTADTFVVGVTNADGGLNTTDQGVIPGYFVDGQGERIRIIFKLHPWEHFLNLRHTRHGFGETAMHDLMSARPTIWIEPPYKMLWSNKGILALLWQEYKNDPVIGPLLLPTYFVGDPNMPDGFMLDCVLKPLLGREGANVTIYQGGNVLERGGGIYGAEGYVAQQHCSLPTFHDRSEGVMYAVAGLWMVRDESAGLCLRESSNRITNNCSYFAPHMARKGH